MDLPSLTSLPAFFNKVTGFADKEKSSVCLFRLILVRFSMLSHTVVSYPRAALLKRPGGMADTKLSTKQQHA